MGYLIVLTYDFHFEPGKFLMNSFRYLSPRRLNRRFLTRWMAVAYFVWAVIPHFRIVVHAHPNSAQPHQHVGLSPYQWGASFQKNQTIGKETDNREAPPDKRSRFRSSKNLGLHSHFIEEANGVGKVSPPPAYTFSYGATVRLSTKTSPSFQSVFCFQSRAPPNVKTA